MPTIKFDRRTRNAVCKASDGLPSIQTWLDRITAIGNPLLTETIEGIWCGEEGSERLELPGSNSVLVVTWYRKKVETSYIS